jgi:hypothetical protein
VAAEAALDVPDACAFIDRAQLEEIIGRELREGERKDAQPGFSECDFETPPLLYVTRTFPDPALPESTGFSSIKINTHPANPQNFSEFRQTLGAAAEDVPGIGDGAYFYGPDLLYVRVGNRGMPQDVREPENDSDRTRTREVVETGRPGCFETLGRATLRHGGRTSDDTIDWRCERVIGQV